MLTSCGRPARTAAAWHWPRDVYKRQLANDLGNLVNRTLNMLNRFAGGVVPAAGEPEEAEREVQALWEKTRGEFLSLSEGFQFHACLLYTSRRGRFRPSSRNYLSCCR